SVSRGRRRQRGESLAPADVAAGDAGRPGRRRGWQQPGFCESAGGRRGPTPVGGTPRSTKGGNRGRREGHARERRVCMGEGLLAGRRNTLWSPLRDTTTRCPTRLEPGKLVP